MKKGLPRVGEPFWGRLDGGLGRWKSGSQEGCNRCTVKIEYFRGMKAAKARGVKIGGKEPKIFAEDILRLKEQGLKMTEIAKELGCSRQALYLALGRGKK